MKNICNFSRIAVLTLSIITCFSTTAFSQDYYIMLKGYYHELGFEDFNSSQYLKMLGTSNKLSLPFTGDTALSFEIDVKEEKVNGSILNSTRKNGQPLSFSVDTSLSDGCGVIDRSCGIYLKVTDPNGNVIVDRSTPETGIMPIQALRSTVPPIPGKYTIRIKLSDPTKTLYSIEVRVSGTPIQ